jgi:two-component system, LuxR family, response regulator FixJ
METEPTVHIVDDDGAVRQSLECLLHAAGFKSMAYETALGFLDAAPGVSAGCVLLDVRMPEMGGLEIQARLNRLGCPLPVIVMTGGGEVEDAVRAMKAGAVDFIEKPFDDERLLGAIGEALVVSEPSARDREAAEAAEQIGGLSRRERQVLDALSAGRPNKVVAYDLGISVRTVEVHRARMLERLGVRSLAEAIRLAVLATLAPASIAPGLR